MQNTTTKLLVAGTLLATISSCTKGSSSGTTSGGSFSSTFPGINKYTLVGNSGVANSNGSGVIHDRVQFGVTNDGTLSLSYNSDPYTGENHAYKFTMSSASSGVASGTITDSKDASINLSATLGEYNASNGKQYYQMTVSGSPKGYFQSTTYTDTL